MNMDSKGCTAIVPLLLLCIPLTTTSGEQQILYVKANASSPCPDDDRIVACQTLNMYGGNTYRNLCASNTLMLFEGGSHQLNTSIEVYNCHNFTMAGNGSALRESNGHPKPTATINCTGTLNGGILFTNSSNISIYNLVFDSCSGVFTVDKTYNITYAGSLGFHLVTDFSLGQVVVTNAKGYGLYTADIQGTNNQVNDSVFSSTTRNPNTRNSGNAGLNFNHVYAVTNLTINSSWFLQGESKKLSGGVIVYISCPNVSVKIVNVTAQGNIGENGGNLAIFLFLYNKNSSMVIVDNSQVIDGKAKKGGGLRVTSNGTTSSGSTNNISHVLIRNTIFRNNSCRSTGGALYIAYYSEGMSRGIGRQVTIQNCTFISNRGDGGGAAMEIIQHYADNSPNDHHYTYWFQTSIESCTFVDNYIPFNDGGPILDFISVEVSLTDCTFTGSNTTVIALRNTYVNLYGDILFQNNRARVGGALKVCDSSLIFAHNGTNVRFVNNHAQEGGAIYVQQRCMDTWPLCPIQPAMPKYIPVVEFSKLMKFVFTNNSATIAGDAVYGGSLDRCTTIVPYILNSTNQNIYHYYWYSKEIFTEIFDTRGQQGPSWITSDPFGVCFCQGSQEYNYNMSCITNLKPEQAYYPGEEITVSMITVGQMNGSTRGMIQATLLGEDPSQHCLTQSSLPQMSAQCINLTYILNSNRSSAEISFKPVTIQIASRYTIFTANLTVELLHCPLGFRLTDAAPLNCKCNPLFTELNLQVVCDINNKSISVPQKTMWFGCFDPKQPFVNESLQCDSLAVTKHCNSHCRSSGYGTNVEVPVNDIDSQCSPGHTGIMCGACRPGYSRIFGDPFECHKGCKNSYIPLTLLVSLTFGILVVFIIIGLNLTVTEGTLNGLLVYTMVIQTHYSYFPDNPSIFGQTCWVILLMINLTFGLKTCFFEGMDGYQQIWATFVQTFYFLFIMAVIITLSRKFIFFTRLFGRNIVKVLATLVFLLYTNLVFATIVALQFATLYIHDSNGTQYSKLIWYHDGNIPYFGPKHIPLFIVASICAVIMLFFVISLLLIQCLQKRSELVCFRWVEKFRPFYEAFTGPCHDSYRFWPGFVLFMRSGLYVMNFLIPAYSDTLFRIKMLVTAAVFVMIMSLACIFPQGVYKRWPLNILEFSFYLNLCITSGFLGLDYNRRRNISVVYTSVSISAFASIGILIYHFYSRIKGTNLWKKVTSFCCPLKDVGCFSLGKPDSNQYVDDIDDDGERPLLPH